MRGRISAALAVPILVASVSCGGVATTSVSDGGTQSGGASTSGASNGGVSANAGGLTGSSGFLGGAAVGGSDCAFECAPPNCPPGTSEETLPGFCCATCSACAGVRCSAPQCPPSQSPYTPPGACCPVGCGSAGAFGGNSNVGGAPSACVDDRTRYLAFRQSLLTRSDIRCKQDTDCQAIAYANPCDPTSCSLVASSGVITDVIVDLDNYAAQNGCSQACNGVPVASCGASTGETLCGADGLCTVMSGGFP